jgi:hypothetical protein
MNPTPPFQLMLPFFVLAATAAAIGCLLYVLGRYVDRRFPDSIVLFGGWAIFFALIVVAVAVFGDGGGLLTVVFFGACLFGSWIHLKTGATSAWDDAFVFVLAVVEANIAVGSLVFAVSPLSQLQASFSINRFVFTERQFYGAALVLAPIFSMVVVRMIQHVQPRPGVDRHLSGDEEAK